MRTPGIWPKDSFSRTNLGKDSSCVFASSVSSTNVCTSGMVSGGTDVLLSDQCMRSRL